LLLFTYDKEEIEEYGMTLDIDKLKGFLSRSEDMTESGRVSPFDFFEISKGEFEQANSEQQARLLQEGIDSVRALIESVKDELGQVEKKRLQKLLTEKEAELREAIEWKRSEEESRLQTLVTTDLSPTHSGSSSPSDLDSRPGTERRERSYLSETFHAHRANALVNFNFEHFKSTFQAFKTEVKIEEADLVPSDSMPTMSGFEGTHDEISKIYKITFPASGSTSDSTSGPIQKPKPIYLDKAGISMAKKPGQEMDEQDIFNMVEIAAAAKMTRVALTDNIPQNLIGIATSALEAKGIIVDPQVVHVSTPRPPMTPATMPRSSRPQPKAESEKEGPKEEEKEEPKKEEEQEAPEEVKKPEEKEESKGKEEEEENEQGNGDTPSPKM